MADNTAANVFVAGGNGAIAHAPVGTTLPTTSAEALDNAFEKVGYISDAGLTETIDRETKKIKAWQNGDVVRVVQTGHSLTYGFGMLERNDESVLMFYGNGTAADVELNGDALAHESYVIDVLDGTDVIRIVIPDGQVISNEPIAYKGDDPVMFGVVIECFPDDDGNKAYQYNDAELS